MKTATPHSFEADLTWLLHRSAHRLRSVIEAQSAPALDVRGYLVLTALVQQRGMTQLALSQAIGLDKTTMTVLLDKLEAAGRIVRRAAPNDRRARIPEVTATGRSLQGRIARVVAKTEAGHLAAFSAPQQRLFRSMLRHLIGDEALAGSCL